MPIYEYICDTCHDQFEMRRSFSDEGVPACPNCNGTGRVRRMFSPPAIVFKGSGFYVNDSRGKKSTSSPASKSDSTETTPTTTDTASSNGKAKPEVKAEKTTNTKSE